VPKLTVDSKMEEFLDSTMFTQDGMHSFRSGARKTFFCLGYQARSSKNLRLASNG
jgi:hypothetical protein